MSFICERVPGTIGASRIPAHVGVISDRLGGSGPPAAGTLIHLNLRRKVLPSKRVIVSAADGNMHEECGGDALMAAALLPHAHKHVSTHMFTKKTAGTSEEHPNSCINERFNKEKLIKMQIEEP